MTSAKWILDGVMQDTVNQPMLMDSFGEVELLLVESYGAMQTDKLEVRSQASLELLEAEQEEERHGKWPARTDEG